ncbi:NADH-quinone oxidoreductase subunit J [Helicobacter salomonis]|uniref:NADH-quinone oxidoreductase subunit J n=1 Tax=Helicobacter salomonis TaxID=56878 RepID=UPI000CF02B40|nr:NADH-quinone oxidoreductase subunit J [Helicobacter salomonis]
MLDTIAFYFFAIITLGMALVVITTKNILYAMSALAVAMVFIAAFFFLLGAEFLGVVQIIVYVGAVIVMYAFGMMFFNASEEVIERAHAPKIVVFLGACMAIVLVLILGAPFVGEYASFLKDALNNTPSEVSNTKLVGYALFTKYLLAFEVSGLMLLVALVGGIATALRKSHFNPTSKENM